eukprot:496374_1
MTYVMLVDSNSSLQELLNATAPDTGCHEQTESKQYTDATEHTIQITSILADTEENAPVDTEIFKFNKCDIPLFVALVIVGSPPLFLGFVNVLHFYHALTRHLW